MNYQVALQFEDGVTRIIECAPGGAAQKDSSQSQTVE